MAEIKFTAGGSLPPLKPASTLYEQWCDARRLTNQLRSRLDACQHAWHNDGFTVTSVPTMVRDPWSGDDTEMGEHYAKVERRHCTKCGLRQHSERTSDRQPPSWRDVL